MNSSLNASFVQFPWDIPINSTICIYGVGSRGVQLLKYLQEYRKDVVIKCFVDSYSQMGSHQGLKVYNLQDFIKQKESYDFIIIASYQWQQIISSLMGQNITQVKILGFHFASCLSTLEVSCDYYLNEFQDDEQYYQNLMMDVLDIFDDEEDKQLYKKLFAIRNGKLPYEVLKEQLPSLENVLFQYLDYIKKDEIKTVVDAGVYDGAGIAVFFRFFPLLKKVYGFEPLKNIYCCGLEYVLGDEELKKTEIIPLALSDKKQTMQILNLGHGSALSVDKNQQNTLEIETVPLDLFWDNDKKLDFIKLDVENAEMDVLKGAIETIKKDRPQIATSIYHSKEQFFGIPLFLKENLDNYTFKLSHYSFSLAETVLYAIPNEIIGSKPFGRCGRI